jgi:lysyl-tRNA synthetase class 2
LDPNQYYERRLRGLATAKASGSNPYPHKFHVSTYLPQFVAQYGSLEVGSRLEETVSIAGRAQSARY